MKAFFPGFREVLMHAHEGDSLIAWDYKCFLSRIKDLIEAEVERRM